MKTPTRSVLSLALLVSLASSAASLAAPSRSDGVASKVVRFGDLDLATAVGAETLYERIAAAARVVCRGSLHAQVRECRTRAVDDAVRAIGSPILTSVHRSTVGRVEEVVLR